MPTTAHVLGLSTDAWTAIAAIAQALAAVGAIALLVVTRISQRDARASIEQARRLVAETEALAAVGRASQELAVRPILEVAYESRRNRIYITNRGNGPLLGPVVWVAAEQVSLVRQDPVASAFREVGALAVGDTATVVLDRSLPTAGTVELQGTTMAGTSYRGVVECRLFTDSEVLVAS